MIEGGRGRVGWGGVWRDEAIPANTKAKKFQMIESTGSQLLPNHVVVLA